MSPDSRTQLDLLLLRVASHPEITYGIWGLIQTQLDPFPIRDQTSNSIHFSSLFKAKEQSECDHIELS